ncbi:hypothetical protein BDZ45DRAFT_749803 [Acephala macrosclerotiorum]|nr:hypothetical protein BDZ45DRAFT_749803 [Acephala macrosclerotiorum]
MQTTIKGLHSEFLAASVLIQFWIGFNILRPLLIPDRGAPDSITVAVAAFMIICFFPSALLPSMSGRRPGSVKTGFEGIPHSDWILDWLSFALTVLLVSGLLQWLLSHFDRFRGYSNPWLALSVQYGLFSSLIVTIALMQSFCRLLVRRLRKERNARDRWPGDLNARPRAEPERTSPVESDGKILWLAWLLLMNFMVLVLWYAYQYDSEGTELMSWTSVFGK